VSPPSQLLHAPSTRSLARGTTRSFTPSRTRRTSHPPTPLGSAAALPLPPGPLNVTLMPPRAAPSCPPPLPWEGGTPLRGNHTPPLPGQAPLVLCTTSASTSASTTDSYSNSNSTKENPCASNGVSMDTSAGASVTYTDTVTPGPSHGPTQSQRQPRPRPPVAAAPAPPLYHSRGPYPANVTVPHTPLSLSADLEHGTGI